MRDDGSTRTECSENSPMTPRCCSWPTTSGRCWMGSPPRWFRVVQVPVYPPVAEQRARHARLLQPRDRIAERMREPLDIRLVRVPLECRRELETVLHAVQAGRNQRGECEIRIRVGT